MYRDWDWERLLLKIFNLVQVCFIRAGAQLCRIVDQGTPVSKGILHFFLEIDSFYHSPREKLLGFTVFECIQLIF